MDVSAISTFRSDIMELPPILTRQKIPKNSTATFSFAQHDSQLSITSTENDSSGRSITASSKSSVTELDSVTAGEKLSESSTTVLEITSANTPKKPAKIRYLLKILNSNGTEKGTLSQDDIPFDLSSVKEKEAPPKKESQDDSPPAIFEIFTTAEANDKEKHKIVVDPPAEVSVEAPEPEIPPLKFEDIKVAKLLEVRMEIHSQSLLRAVREVVDYYPNQNLSGDVVIIHEPYMVLIHHRTELHELLGRLQSLGNKGLSEQKETAEHLKVLLDFMRPHIDRVVTPTEKRLQNKVPTITFDALGYLLKPGSFVYCKFAGEWIGSVVLRVKGKKKAESTTIDHWNILVWFLNIQGRLFRGYTQSHLDDEQETKHCIYRYEGEQEVTSLKVIPRQYWDAIDNGARKAQFEARGEKKVDLMNTMFQQLDHKGETLNTKKAVYHGRVILDDKHNIEVGAGVDAPWQWNKNEELKDDEWMNKRGTESTQHISKLASLLEPEDKVHNKISKDQAWMMSPDLCCFALENKSWCCMHVDRLTVPKQGSLPTKLVMEDAHLKIIKALTASQIGTKTSWAADSIKNKGKGVIILLHGQPGVGKTYSVECTADAIKRPLLALTIADIGTKEADIETELTSWFYLAERWKAVLLIDEADIFLERRKHSDLARNGIVSAFLRKMEYFSGLLFLTTNRVGLIDEAFMSRVHLVVGFPPFDDNKRRQVWEGFFAKMSNDTKGGIRLAPTAKAHVLQESSKLKIELNGREIRNVLQTAISLGEYEAKEDEYYKEGDYITVTKDHFESVLEMSRTFKTYIDSVKQDTAKLRAKNYYGRNDEDGNDDDELDKTYK